MYDKIFIIRILIVILNDNIFSRLDLSVEIIKGIKRYNMNEEEYKELLKEIRSLKRQISFLEDKISWLMNILLGYRFSPFPPLDKEKFKIRLEEWRKYIEKEGPNIKKEAEYIKETFEKCGNILSRCNTSL